MSESQTVNDGSGYDEFGLFHENAAEAGLPFAGAPTVARVQVEVAGRNLSALRWGTENPEIVFIHGGGQNAHTWDTVALALDRPLLAVDLPGHGHSGDVDLSRPVGPRTFADEMATVIEELAPAAELVVGMSLGGLTAMHLARQSPHLVRRLMMVDVTPGVTKDKAGEIHAFLAGPEAFDSFEQILERTVQFNPTRSVSSLRRGILHNAVSRDDGTWVWRHQRGKAGGFSDSEAPQVDIGSTWDDLAEVAAPVMLLRGSRSPVVDDEDEALFRQHQPDASVVTVQDAGHSIQGDQPLELARLVREFLGRG